MAHPIHKHMHTHITKRNVGAAVRDDKAHIDYLKRDVLWDNKHGHSDIDMTADEKHISKLAGDIKHDERKEHVSRKSSSPFNARCPEGFKVNPDKNSKTPCIKIRTDEVGSDKERAKKEEQKPKFSRRSSSPLHAHDESKVVELTRKIEARAKELTGDDPQSRIDPYEDDKIKTWIAERTAEKAKHKE